MLTPRFPPDVVREQRREKWLKSQMWGSAHQCNGKGGGRAWYRLSAADTWDASPLLPTTLALPVLQPFLDFHKRSVTCGLFRFLFMELNSELFFTLDGDGGPTHWLRSWSGHPLIISIRGICHFSLKLSFWLTGRAKGEFEVKTRSLQKAHLAPSIILLAEVDRLGSVWAGWGKLGAGGGEEKLPPEPRSRLGSLQPISRQKSRYRRQSSSEITCKAENHMWEELKAPSQRLAL